MTATSTQNIAAADQLMIGRGADSQVRRRAGHYGHAGIPVMLPTLVELGAPKAADADHLVKAATSTELPAAAGTISYTPATDGTSPLDNADTPAAVTLRLPHGGTALVWPLDVPRNLAVTATHATAVVALTVKIYGYDQYRRPMTETLAIAATGTSQTATGAKAFGYVSSIAITAAADATGNTVNIGIGAKLGLPYRLERKEHLLAAFLGGAQELVNVASNATVVPADATDATSATSDVRGTVSFNGTLNASNEALVWMYVSGHATGQGIAGKSQA